MNTVYIHTDGSSDNRIKEAGWAFCLSKYEKTEVLHQDSGYTDGTNNVGELKGVINALHYTHGNVKTKKVLVFTDSKYVSDTVYFNYYGWFEEKELKDRPNIKLWIKLRNIIKSMKMRGVTVEIRWKRGHNGDPLNELVDKLAVKARHSKKINELYG